MFVISLLDTTIFYLEWSWCAYLENEKMEILWETSLEFLTITMEIPTMDLFRNKYDKVDWNIMDTCSMYM